MSLYPLSFVRRPASGLFRHSAFCILHSAFFLLSASAWAGSNLVVNGHFSDTNEFLHGWKYNYEDTGNELMAANHTHVAVTNEGSKNHVLALQANKILLWDIGQGVMVDSDPIPVAPGGRFKLTISAKSTGPNCRILVEGYRWKPGVKPHAHPKLKEVRKCYRFAQVYFGAEKAGTMGGISPAMGWTKASQTFPDEKMTKLALESFDKVQFLVIHIAAFSGTWKDPEWVYLYVDDVELERINK
ncbi:MAG: hypothetical protein NT011_10205 [Kiritimatiellaeota bacterium]|nr:hypothetical protein [Kiritimatiellota bacterium]